MGETDFKAIKIMRIKMYLKRYLEGNVVKISLNYVFLPNEE